MTRFARTHTTRTRISHQHELHGLSLTGHSPRQTVIVTTHAAAASVTGRLGMGAVCPRAVLRVALITETQVDVCVGS